MSEIFQAPAILTRIAYTKDRGLSLGFVTQELTDEAKVAAANYHQQFGHLLFKANEFTEADVPTEDAEKTGKTPSKRLRNALFVFWQQTESSSGDFEAFYRQEMEKFINHVKGKIDLF